MADDGMLLNFDLGGVAVSKPVKFKGGRWRDRNRAQRSAKREQDGEAPNSENAENPDKDRAAKRRRVEGGARSGGHGGESLQLPLPLPMPSRTAKPHGRPSAGGVTSRLFTSNPAPVTDLVAAAAAVTAAEEAETEPVQPSNAPLTDEASTFLALGLSRRIAQHLSAKLGLKAPTAIQQGAVPQLVHHDHDAFLQAETGSGKTLAYLLPMVQRILSLSELDDGRKRMAADGSGPIKVHRNAGLFAIVLAPTRELCKQISVVLEKLLRCAPWIVSTTVIGGESKKAEKARIRKGVNILIATPGRLTDHLDNTEVLDVGTVRWLVLDEGDRLMEMGFEDDIRAIVAKIRQHALKNTARGEKEADDADDAEERRVALPPGVLPARRVTVLCSATMKMNVQKLGEISLEDAVHVTGGNDGKNTSTTAENDDAFSAPAQLKQTYAVVPAKLRLITLIALLRATFARKGSVMKAIVFMSCADAVDFHYDLLHMPTEDLPADGDEAAAAAAAAAGPTAATVGPAAYIASAANRTVMLHRLHGSLAQPVRTATLAAFSREKNPAVLVTTDIASRGLDVPAVDLVIEYDPAFAVADHLHRIGRTARAGRPGKAMLFLQPGCEEGYVALLQSSAAAAPMPQLYDTILQAGFAAAVDLPPSLAAVGTDDTHDPTKAQSWSKRAEALQLHLEQRLLRADKTEPPTNRTAPTDRKDKKEKYKHQQSKAKKDEPKDSKLLEEARQAFQSHIRAYATHVRDERVYFDISQLHLGHMAKSFGLREAPGGIGRGVQRRTKRPASGAPGKTASARSTGGKTSHSADSDDERAGGAVDEEAAKRMRQRMLAVMNASSEFNIG